MSTINNHIFNRLALAVVLSVTSFAAVAQTTVFRCEVSGRSVFSDLSCGPSASLITIAAMGAPNRMVRTDAAQAPAAEAPLSVEEMEIQKINQQLSQWESEKATAQARHDQRVAALQMAMLEGASQDQGAYEARLSALKDDLANEMKQIGQGEPVLRARLALISGELSPSDR